MEKVNTRDIMDKHDGMPSQTVTAFKKGEIKSMDRIQEAKQVNAEQIINVARFGEYQIILTS